MFFICLLFSCLFSSFCLKNVDKNIQTNTVFKRSDSPIIITKNITISKKIKLTIEPGTVIKIYPKVKIDVVGTLIAKGLLNDRIVFTKVGKNKFDHYSNLNVQLVDGNEYREGKLRIKINNKWQYVCSQNQEWTFSDVKVVCNELGFLHGNFSLNGRAENDTSHVLLKSPGCKGNETNLKDCNGYESMTIGSIACNLQELVGLHCWGANPKLFQENWWGITFYNSSITETLFDGQNTRLNMSSSVLEYVDILYAGVNSSNHRVAALSASPYPPKLSYMKFMFNAYDAINFTDIRGPAVVTDSVLKYNGGHGMNITSAIGYVRINKVISQDNLGSGGYLRVTSKHWTEETPELVDQAKQICGSSVIPSSLLFPFMILTEHNVPSYKSSDTCYLNLHTDRRSQVLSIKLLEAVRDRTAGATIKITDIFTNRLLAYWNFTAPLVRSSQQLIYGPLYQGVTSVGQKIKIEYIWTKSSTKKYCPFLKECFRGILQISAAETTSPEISVENSLFKNNWQHGLRIENLGLYGRIRHSHFISNQFGAGLQIVNGSSDILIHKCKFIENDRTGLNITTAGGTRIINGSQFISNDGHGLDIWNPTWLMTRSPNLPITSIVHLSHFEKNLWNGIRLYNSSFPMNILVNFSTFRENNRNGIEMVSTIANKKVLLTNFTVGFSEFSKNGWHGISILPMGQMTGHIVNSTFYTYQGLLTGGAIYMDNGINFQEQRVLYQSLPVKYSIRFNSFLGRPPISKGADHQSAPFVVSVRLSQTSALQECLIELNRFSDNRILQFQSPPPPQYPWPVGSNTISTTTNVPVNTAKLNPRSYMHAVIVIGSSNVVVTRNFIRNTLSTYEIASQLEASNTVINASKNFWGSENDFPGLSWEKIHGKVFERLFDQASRYTLANIEYFPLLKESNLHSDIVSSTDPKYRHVFRQKNSHIVGGMIDLNMEQRVKLENDGQSYIVTRDIFVPLTAVLTIEPGVVLEFENSVGFFVQGSVVMMGTPDKPIKLIDRQMSNRKTGRQLTVNTRGQFVELLTKQQLSVQNISKYINSSLINNTIPVADNNQPIQGVVRVQINGTWTTICNNRMDIVAARIICTNLGLVAHHLDWKVEPHHRIDTVLNDSISLSALRCQPWHTRIEQCDYDYPSSTLSATWCPSSIGLVNIRCRLPGWAGMKISLTNDLSQLSNVHVQHAGLFDYHIPQYSPAVQIDYNKHLLDQIKIEHGMWHGLLINLNDAYSARKVTHIEAIGNLGDGIVVRNPWVEFNYCNSRENRGAGLRYDPAMSEEELFQFRSAMYKTQNLIGSSSSSVTRLSMHPSGIEVLYTTKGTSLEKTVYWAEIRTTDINSQHQLLVSLIDFNPKFDEENVTFYDNEYSKVREQLANPSKTSSSITYSLPKDIARFPILSNGRAFTVAISINDAVRSGRLALLVQSRSFINYEKGTTASGSFAYPITMMNVVDSNITDNADGIVVTHYNAAVDSQSRTYTMRHSRLDVTVTNCVLADNKGTAIYIPSVSPYKQDLYFPTYGDDIGVSKLESSDRICRIRYKITKNKFLSNAVVLRADHNHVPFSNNVWRYQISDNVIQRNTRHGIAIQMPFVSQKFDWRYIIGMQHEIRMFKNDISNNNNFQIEISGYYLLLSIFGNKITNNICYRKGLISLVGMEKKFNISHNELVQNRGCNYIIETNIYSQTETAEAVRGVILYNTIKNNDCEMIKEMSVFFINCYVIGIFGNQNVTINRNIFINKKFSYQLVAGLISSHINDYLDAQYNYWDSTNVNEIRKVIFDSNNWNNYAEANFGKFLLTNIIDTTRFYTGKIDPYDFNKNSNVLGGKIVGRRSLDYRKDGYFVENDLTVMPNSELVINPGVKIFFKPNIGLLVLGKLTAKGTMFRPITLTTYYENRNVTRSKRAAGGDKIKSKLKLNLIGGKLSNEGFIRIYNTTAMRWDYVCDSQFSRDVAMVACRQMGLEADNVQVRRSHLLDYQLYGYDNPFVVKHVWTLRYTCRGYENEVDNCVKRVNYDYYGCLLQRNFVFVRCGTTNLRRGERYWGNIRIVLSDLANVKEDQRSVMEYVNIEKAGVLHGELVSAVQTTYGFISADKVKISQCAWNGMDVIAPRYFVQISNCTFRQNSGYGAALTILNSDTSDPLTSTSQQMMPLAMSPLPSSVLGLLDMCDIKKEWQLDNRLILFYRYSYRTTACTKLIRSRIPNRQIAVRFLQLNLFYDPFTKNKIELYNGDDFNVTELLTMVDAVRPGQQNQQTGTDNDDSGELNGFRTDKLPSIYTKSGYDKLGVHLHASPASEKHGFIMELLALPISADGIFLDHDRFTQHQITESEFQGNQRGAVHVSVVGVSNPQINIYYNRFVSNSGPPLLNLTGSPTLLVRLFNCRHASISNNWFLTNHGSATELHLYSSDLNKAVRLNYTNNMITNTSHGSALRVFGNYISSMKVFRNYFARNLCENRDLIRVHGTLMKSFSHNYVTENVASVMINASGSDLSDESIYEWNGFYNNLAVNYTRSTTIYSDNTKNIFKYNYFRNMGNDYELTVGNRTIMKDAKILVGDQCSQEEDCSSGWVLVLELNKCICYRPDKVVARFNWWGDGKEFYVAGKVWSKKDDRYLIPVDYGAALKENKTVLDGSLYCPPTWNFINQNCYYYFGGPVTYQEANDFCQKEAGAILANSGNDVTWVDNIIKSWQNNYEWLNRYSYNTRAWIRSHVPLNDRCSAVRSTWLEGIMCDTKVQFICQKSPYGVYLGLQLEVLVALIILGILLLLLLIFLLYLWWKNSRDRHKEYLLRIDRLKQVLTAADTAVIGRPRYLDIKYPDEYSATLTTTAPSSRSHPSTASHYLRPNNGVSRYDNDQMEMRRNTLTDMRETISKPKLTSTTYRPENDIVMIPVEKPTRMIDPRYKKSQQQPQSSSSRGNSSRPRQPTRNSTLDKPVSSVSMEALYMNVEPGSQVRLSQPDVPLLAKPHTQQQQQQHQPTATTASTASLKRGTNRSMDPSRMNTMVDSSLDPSNRQNLNQPVIQRSNKNLRSVSQRESKESSSSSSDTYDPRGSSRKFISPEKMKRNPKQKGPSPAPYATKPIKGIKMKGSSKNSPLLSSDSIDV